MIVWEFFRDIARFDFLQYALLTGVLASVACGIIGTYVVTRRITYIAGGISHTVLGGMGAALFVQKAYGMQWAHPLLGAVVAALLSAVVIGVVSLRAKQREDTVIGAIWAIGMAVGVLFIAKTPGYNQELMSFLFGNILMVSPRDLWIIGGLDLLVVATSLVFYSQLLAVCFDEEFARLRGLNVEFYYLLLLCLAALTVVLMVTVVGAVMVIALLTLPVAVAGIFSSTLWRMMGLSIALSTIFTTAGLVISYPADLPAGATIIAVSGAAYITVVAANGILRSSFFKRK
jgi:zinc transport system permease protein